MEPSNSATEDRGLERVRIAELTLRIAERANRLAQERGMPPGCELALWLEAEAQVKRERRASGRRKPDQRKTS